jgi:hypothetical protein
MNLQTLLKNETWESVDIERDPKHVFNSFLQNFLNIFEATFPVVYSCMRDKNDNLQTQNKSVGHH